MNLAFIQANFSFLPQTIVKLQKSGLPLVESLAIVSEAEEKINALPEPVGLPYKGKVRDVLAKNPGLETLRMVGKVLQLGTAELPAGMQPCDVANLKFVPIVSVDVERSFSQFKNILSDRRHNLTKENLSKIVVTTCFYNSK